jgi:hypothetical protein
MTHLIYIYLIINSYLVGRYIGAYAKSDNRFEVLGYSFCLFLFGGILGLLLNPLIWSISKVSGKIKLKNK